MLMPLTPELSTVLSRITTLLPPKDSMPSSETAPLQSRTPPSQ